MQFIKGRTRFRRFIFLAALAAATGAALWGDNLAYEVASNAEFGVVDLNTGAFTYIGNQGDQLAGLGLLDGVLYGGLSYTDAVVGNNLYRINVATGALTNLGSGSVLYNDFGSTLTGLYGIGTDGNLYSVNPSNGADTLIGATGLGAPTSTVGLSTNSSTLYYSFGGDLYTLNTSTGAATLVGALGTTEDGAMVSEGGSLWAGINSPLSLDTVNTSTGAAAFAANVSGTAEAFWGLAPESMASTPEPATSSLLAPAALLLALCESFRRVWRKSPRNSTAR
jgi:hypothetical protein